MNETQEMKHCTTLLYLLSAVVLSTCAPQTDTDRIRDERYTESSILKMGRNDYDQALMQVDTAEQQGIMTSEQAILLRVKLALNIKKDFATAETICNHALDSDPAIGNTSFKARLLHLQGTAALKGKRFVEALVASLEGRDIAQELGMPFLEESFNFLVGRCFFELNRETRGLNLMSRALSRTRSLARTKEEYNDLLAMYMDEIYYYSLSGNESKITAEQKTIEELIHRISATDPSADTLSFHLFNHFLAGYIQSMDYVRKGRKDLAKESFLKDVPSFLTGSRVAAMLEADVTAARGDTTGLLRALADIPDITKDTLTLTYVKKMSLLEQAYLTAGDSVKASLYQLRLNNLKSEISEKKHSEKAYILASKYDVLRVAIDSSKQQMKSFRRALLLVSLILITILAVVLASYERSRRRLAGVMDYSEDLKKDMDKLQRKVNLIAKANRMGSSTENAALSNLVEGKQLYLDPSVSRVQVVEMLGCTQKDMTKMLNEIETGLSFPDYIKGLRIKHALSLMKESEDKSISQIANESGFYTLRSFQLAFKSVTGKTPSEFRSDIHKE